MPVGHTHGYERCIGDMTNLELSRDELKDLPCGVSVEREQGTRNARLCPRYNGHQIQRVDLEEKEEGLEREVEREGWIKSGRCSWIQESVDSSSIEYDDSAI